jgi:hypothetical protein
VASRSPLFQATRQSYVAEALAEVGAARKLKAIVDVERSPGQPAAAMLTG